MGLHRAGSERQRIPKGCGAVFFAQSARARQGGGGPEQATNGGAEKLDLAAGGDAKTGCDIDASHQGGDKRFASHAGGLGFGDQNRRHYRQWVQHGGFVNAVELLAVSLEGVDGCGFGWSESLPFGPLLRGAAGAPEYAGEGLRCRLARAGHPDT
jgi:hypothetical protein